jgi:hypothetical protein
MSTIDVENYSGRGLSHARSLGLIQRCLLEVAQIHEQMWSGVQSGDSSPASHAHIPCLDEWNLTHKDLYDG